MKRRDFTAACMGIAVLLISCGGSGSGTGDKALKYTLGGTVNGLSVSRSLELVNNGANGTVVSANGTFILSTTSGLDESYAVNVRSQPQGMSCTVTNASGVVKSSVNNVAVKCYKNPALAYMINSQDWTLSAYAINPKTGVLSSTGAAIPTESSPTSIAVDPTGSFAYVVSVNKVSTYNINAATGRLTLAGAAATGNFPSGVTLDPKGKFAFVANYFDSSMWVTA